MILVHDEYDPVSLHADIAMLKMSDRIESWSDFIQPACIRWLEVRCWTELSLVSCDFLEDTFDKR